MHHAARWAALGPQLTSAARRNAARHRSHATEARATRARSLADVAAWFVGLSAFALLGGGVAHQTRLACVPGTPHGIRTATCFSHRADHRPVHPHATPAAAA